MLSNFWRRSSVYLSCITSWEPNVAVIHQSWRCRVNFDSSKYSNLCWVIMDSRWHYSSRRPCPPDWSGVHHISCSSLMYGFSAVDNLWVHLSDHLFSFSLPKFPGFFGEHILPSRKRHGRWYYMVCPFPPLHSCCTSDHHWSVFFAFLLCRDVVQSKLENLGQVCYLSLSPSLSLHSHTIFC